MRWRCPSPSSRSLRASDLMRGSHLARKAQLMGSLLPSLRMHWDDELIYLGRARLRRGLIFVALKGFQGSTESRPTLRFMGSLHGVSTAHSNHEPSAARVGARASWTVATESSESPLWVGAAASTVGFGILQSSKSQAPNPKEAPSTKLQNDPPSCWTRVRRWQAG